MSVLLQIALVFSGIGVSGIGVFVLAYKLYDLADRLVKRTEDTAAQRTRADQAEAQLAAEKTTREALQKTVDDVRGQLQRVEQLYASTFSSSDPGPASRDQFVQALKQLTSAVRASGAGGAPDPVPGDGSAAPIGNGLINPFVQGQP